MHLGSIELIENNLLEIRNKVEKGHRFYIHFDRDNEYRIESKITLPHVHLKFIWMNKIESSTALPPHFFDSVNEFILYLKIMIKEHKKNG